MKSTATIRVFDYNHVTVSTLLNTETNCYNTKSMCSTMYSLMLNTPTIPGMII